MSTRLPLWPLQVALYDHLKAHAATLAYRWQTEGGAVAALPFYEFGAVTATDASTDTGGAGALVIQLNAWTEIGKGGRKLAQMMMDAALDALDGVGSLTLATGGTALYLGIADAVLQYDYDEGTAQGSLRLRFNYFG